MTNTAMTNTLDQFLLTDKVAVITGGGKGIGAAIALAFADAGADVAVTARTAEDVESVAAQVRARGRRALAFPADVNDLDAVAALVERTVAELGGVDIVVNNAGGSQSLPFLDTSVELLERSFHFNISVAFELSRLAVPHILRRGGGSVLNISSVAGRKAVRGSLTHSLMKASLSQLTRLMAAELAPLVRVNAILPGAIETDALRAFLSSMDPSVRAGMIERTALRRNGRPEDIAAAALYFCSPAASWVSGKLLDVDGLAADELIGRHLPDVSPTDV
ncbi:MAG TPA: glucose 1-dehydrogenase [Acidimicrobiales bacterium]|jgi:7-alpha-hydroxysteroid dehydrogenase|nr:glucose 1-dehydrogenase [Acidimicrobiales bacterium]